LICEAFETVSDTPIDDATDGDGYLADDGGYATQ
jgi:hypothetical protein